MKLLICLAALAALLAPAHAQPGGCMGNCGMTPMPPWTLYVFERGSSGFVQQKLSSHDSLEACEAGLSERFYHLDQVVSARCVPLSNGVGRTKWIKEGPTEVGHY